MPEPIAVGVREAAGMVRLSETEIRSAINRLELPAVRRGRAIRITTDDLRAWIAGLPKVGADA